MRNEQHRQELLGKVVHVDYVGLFPKTDVQFRGANTREVASVSTRRLTKVLGRSPQREDRIYAIVNREAQSGRKLKPRRWQSYPKKFLD